MDIFFCNNLIIWTVIASKMMFLHRHRLGRPCRIHFGPVWTQQLLLVARQMIAVIMRRCKFCSSILNNISRKKIKSPSSTPTEKKKPRDLLPVIRRQLSRGFLLIDTLACVTTNQGKNQLITWFGQQDHNAHLVFCGRYSGAVSSTLGWL